MKRISIFAARADILDVVERVEAKFELLYVLEHHDLKFGPGSVAPKYNSAKDIPALGTATGIDTSKCDRYIVSERGTQIVPMKRVIGGVPRVAFEFGNCPDSIVFNAGGLIGDSALISGLIETWSDEKAAQRLMRAFMSAIKKAEFTKFCLFWVGPRALTFLKQGGRLTHNIAASSEYDMKIPD